MTVDLNVIVRYFEYNGFMYQKRNVSKRLPGREAARRALVFTKIQVGEVRRIARAPGSKPGSRVLNWALP